MDESSSSGLHGISENIIEYYKSNSNLKLDKSFHATRETLSNKPANDFQELIDSKLNEQGRSEIITEANSFSIPPLTRDRDTDSDDSTTEVLDDISQVCFNMYYG